MQQFDALVSDMSHDKTGSGTASVCLVVFYWVRDPRQDMEQGGSVGSDSTGTEKGGMQLSQEMMNRSQSPGSAHQGF